MNTGSSSMLSSASISNETASNGPAIEKYTDALNRYYQLKSRYEGEISNKKKGIKTASKSNRERRDMFRKFTPMCVSCGRKVGSTFTTTSSKDDTLHTAICGDTKNPCQLDIKLKSDSTYNIRKERVRELEIMHKYGKNVIRLMNDGMFGYITGDAVVETHDAYEHERIAEEAVQKKRESIMKLRDDVSTSEVMYSRVSLADNKDKQLLVYTATDLLNEHVASIKSNIKEYARSGNRQFIRDSIQLYANEMRENINTLNSNKYARMAVERSDKPTTYTLYQESSTIGSWLLDDHDPQVVRFTIGKKLATPEKRESEAEFVPPAIPSIATAAISAISAISSAVLADPEPDSELSPVEDPSPIIETIESDDDVSEAESEEDEGDPLPRIHIGETVDTSSDDGVVPPPPPISDLELSSSDDGFVPPPPPIEGMEDSSSDGFVPPPPIEDTDESSEAA